MKFPSNPGVPSNFCARHIVWIHALKLRQFDLAIPRRNYFVTKMCIEHADSVGFTPKQLHFAL